VEARNASLARLRRCGQELDGGIVAIDTSTSCVLVDLEHHRFGCITLESDVDTQVTLGRWHRFDDIWCDGGDIVIAPSANVAPIRIHPRTGGVT
jgi:hypothetical protein